MDHPRLLLPLLLFLFSLLSLLSPLPPVSAASLGGDHAFFQAVPDTLLAATLPSANVELSSDVAADPMASSVDVTSPKPLFDASLSRQTALGAIMGGLCEQYSGVLHFLGVPYAKPPLGHLRFRPPEPYDMPYPEPAFMALANGATCSSICIEGDGANTVLDYASEDCLFLNVWAPKELPATPLPVRAYIHGGHDECSASDPHSDGCAAVAKTDCVQVAFEFRRGPMGSLVHAGTLAESNVTGNWALMDQQLALKWIQDNIAAFGGDPSRVLLFGNSAGAQAVEIHVVSPLSAGYFHSAISESPPCVYLPTLEQGYDYTAQFLPQVGCDGLKDPAAELECLRNVPWKMLYNLTEILTDNYRLNFVACNFRDRFQVFDYVVDGTTIPTQVHEALKTGNFNKVPFMVGTTTDEEIYGLDNLVDVTNVTSETILSTLELLYPGTDPERVLQVYPEPLFASDPQPNLAKLVQILTDISFNCPVHTRLMARSEYLDEAPTWVYHWGATPSCPPEWTWMRAHHACELNFVFGNMPTAMFTSGECTFTQEEVELSDIVLTAWTGMAQHGAPVWSNGTTWAPWDSVLQRSNFLDKGLTSIIATDRVQMRCQVHFEQAQLAKSMKPESLEQA